MTGGDVGSGVDVSWAHQGAEEVVVERGGGGVGHEVGVSMA